mgnify:CR=1 FL=1
MSSTSPAPQVGAADDVLRRHEGGHVRGGVCISSAGVERSPVPRRASTHLYTGHRSSHQAVARAGRRRLLRSHLPERRRGGAQARQTGPTARRTALALEARGAALRAARPVLGQAAAGPSIREPLGSLPEPALSSRPSPPLPLPLQDRKGEDTRRGRTSSEAHRVGDSYHRPATHVSLLAASVSVPVVVRDCW